MSNKEDLKARDDRGAALYLLEELLSSLLFTGTSKFNLSASFLKWHTADQKYFSIERRGRFLWPLRFNHFC